MQNMELLVNHEDFVLRLPKAFLKPKSPRLDWWWLPTDPKNALIRKVIAPN